MIFLKCNNVLTGLLLVCAMTHEGNVMTEQKVVLGHTRDNFTVATAALAPCRSLLPWFCLPFFLQLIFFEYLHFFHLLCYVGHILCIYVSTIFTQLVVFIKIFTLYIIYAYLYIIICFLSSWTHPYSYMETRDDQVLENWAENDWGGQWWWERGS